MVVTERCGCINGEIVWQGSAVLQLNFDCILTTWIFFAGEKVMCANYNLMLMGYMSKMSGTYFFLPFRWQPRFFLVLFNDT